METPNEICYLSAATSPTSICSLEETLNFYSAPTSPTSEVSNTFFGFKTEQTTPRNSCDHDHFTHNFLSDHDFEFETSHHFSLESEEEGKNPVECPKRDQFRRQRGDSQSIMAFADELFCNGKVVPLDPPTPKLKLPRGFCNRNVDSGGQSEAEVAVAVAVAELKSPRAIVGLPFPRQCLWNDDFDPFMVALENVREDENRGKKIDGKNARRAWSMSPLRAKQPSEYYLGLLKPHKDGEGGLDSTRLGKLTGSISARWLSPRKLWAGDVKSPTHGRKVPKGLAEPRGVVFARRVRRVKMGQEKFEGPDEPAVSPVRRPESENGKKGRGSKRPCTRGNNRRRKIMRLLFRVSGKEGSDEENKEVKRQNGAIWKSTFLRRLSFRSNGQTQYNRDKNIVSHVAKMTLIQYRPRLSFCMGYGTRYVQ